MAYLILPSRRTRQPSGYARANPAWNPLAAWAFSSPVDVVSGKVATLTSAATFKGQPSGLSLSVAGTAALNRAILNANPAASDFGDAAFTVLVRFVLRSVRESYIAFGRWYGAGVPANNMWYIGAGSGFNSTSCDIGVACGSALRGASITGITWAVGNEYTIIGRRLGTSIWVDRINHTTGQLSSASLLAEAAIGTINSVSARNLKLGEIDAAASLNADIDASVAAIFPYKASDAEVRLLQANPWQIFADTPRRIYFGASGGAGAVTGTSAVTDAGVTGTSSGALALAATSAATASVTTGTAAGAIAIAATSAQTLAATTGTASGAVISGISGTSAATVGMTTGTATGAIALSASSAATIGIVTGTAAGTIALSGASAQTVNDVTGVASGTSTGAASGTSAATVGTTTGTAAGYVDVLASSAVTIGTVTGTAAGTVSGGAITGTSAGTLAALAGAAAGQIVVSGSSSGQLGGVTGPAPAGIAGPAGGRRYALRSSSGTRPRQANTTRPAAR